MKSYQADKIFDGFRFLPESSSIQVDQDGKIISVNQPDGFESVSLSGLLMPGMINVHCHLELSYLFKQIPEKTGLVEFLSKVVSLRNQFSANTIQQAIINGEAEMIRNGIVAVGDICNGLDTLEVKKNSTLYFHSLVECFGLREDKEEEIITRAVSMQHVFRKDQPASIVLHAPYSISNALLQKIDRLSAGQIVSIHNQESSEENILFEQGAGGLALFMEQFDKDAPQRKVSGKTSLITTLEQLHHYENLILVHNTFTSVDDLKFVQNLNRNIYFCLCPKANLFIENRLPNIPMFYEENVSVVFGTDSLASNHTLSIWEEIMTVKKYFPQLPLEKLLASSTSIAAKALGVQDLLGSFTPGTNPGIVHIEKNEKEADSINVLYPSRSKKSQ